MAAKKLTVVISQGQGKQPARRALEEDLAAALIMEPDVDVSLVPHLYDMGRDHSGMLFLRSVPGDLLVLSWLYPRAIRWILDRNGARGREGITLIRGEEEEDEELDETAMDADAPDVAVADVPKRKIYCVDLRARSAAGDYLDEVRRIVRENSVQTLDLMQWIRGTPQQPQLERYLHPERMLAAVKSAPSTASGDGDADDVPPIVSADLPEPTKRRWYPVIDYSRCTNCMECLDFCLFGVYGIDGREQILVEQQDNCKKGCPACSRVCPENAIIFPGHKTPAIAGAEGEVAGLKIDLSKLFGAPSAIEVAALERDAELVADGREAVGMSVGIPKRQTEKARKPKDALDDLMDGLDQLDL